MYVYIHPSIHTYIPYIHSIHTYIHLRTHTHTHTHTHTWNIPASGALSALRFPWVVEKDSWAADAFFEGEAAFSFSLGFSPRLEAAARDSLPRGGGVAVFAYILHIYTHIYIHTCACMCMHMCMHMHMHVHAYTHMHMYMYMYIYMSIHTYMYMQMSMKMCKSARQSVFLSRKRVVHRQGRTAREQYQHAETLLTQNRMHGFPCVCMC